MRRRRSADRIGPGPAERRQSPAPAAMLTTDIAAVAGSFDPWWYRPADAPDRDGRGRGHCHHHRRVRHHALTSPSAPTRRARPRRTRRPRTPQCPPRPPPPINPAHRPTAIRPANTRTPHRTVCLLHLRNHPCRRKPAIRQPRTALPVPQALNRCPRFSGAARAVLLLGPVGQPTKPVSPSTSD